MDKETLKLFRLGVFIITGTILLGWALYLIGRDQNLFGSNVHVLVYFNNINGLQSGNNVRFAGFDAGTVGSVEVISDTTVQVVILLQKKYSSFVKRDAIASIGTDGLMGNRLINITNIPGSNSATVTDGSIIQSQKPVETDEMLRTLNQTNDYVSGLALNLKNITGEISSSRGAIWKLLSDTALSGIIDSVAFNLAITSSRISHISKEFEGLLLNIKNGQGLLGTLIADSGLSDDIIRISGSLKTAGEKSEIATNELLKMIGDVKAGQGTLGLLLRDSSVRNDLKITAVNLKKSSESLDQSMEAMKHIPLLKKYMEQPQKKKKP